MSRIRVVGEYNAQGEYVLRFADGSYKGRIYTVLVPNTVIDFRGGSDGYLVRRVRYARRNALALVRVTPEERQLSMPELLELCKQRRGYILQRDFTGLWAISDGAARRGVFHGVSVSQDPIVNTLREVRMSSSVLTLVQEIDAEVSRGACYCPESADTAITGDHVGFMTDGTAELIVYGTVAAHDDFDHTRCHVIADVFRITGGSWVIETMRRKTSMRSMMRRSITKVLITPSADRQKVAAMILQAMGR